MRQKSVGMIIVLSVVAGLIGAVLAGVYTLAKPKIEANKLAEERRAIFAVLPEATTYETIKRTIQGEKRTRDIRIFKGFTDKNQLVGYAFIAKGAGFQGIIEMMVGIHPDFLKLHGMQVLEQVETPGLGNKISRADFMKQFKGLYVLPRIEYVKNRKPEKPNQIQAITGATISSKSVVGIINRELPEIIEALKEE